VLSKAVSEARAVTTAPQLFNISCDMTHCSLNITTSFIGNACTAAAAAPSNGMTVCVTLQSAHSKSPAVASVPRSMRCYVTCPSACAWLSKDTVTAHGSVQIAVAAAGTRRVC
jgi:hypothetical protein